MKVVVRLLVRFFEIKCTIFEKFKRNLIDFYRKNHIEFYGYLAQIIEVISGLFYARVWAEMYFCSKKFWLLHQWKESTE